jgi:putative oxidoreductase
MGSSFSGLPGPMVSGSENRGLLQLEFMRIEPPGRRPPGAEWSFACLHIERWLGGMEIEQVTNRSRISSRLNFVNAGRLLARLVLGGVFVFAGISKIYDPGTFAIELERYQLFPWKVSAAAANYLPWLEFLAGSCLLLKWFERGALLLITLLLAVFTFGLASALVRGLSIDCGCFGHAFMSTGTIVPILRNFALLLLTGVLWIKFR